MSLPIVAIVGPPNAGKSTLFNKIIGEMKAVTSDVAGTTRDRQYAPTAWNGAAFELVDTAGLDSPSTPSSKGVHSSSAAFKGGARGGESELETSVNKQIDVAAKEAQVIVMVVDGKLSPDSLDRQVLLKFRKSKQPVVLAINKLDSPKNLEALTASFLKLGLKAVFPVSSVTGRGIGDMLDHIVSVLPAAKLDPTPLALSPSTGIAVAIVGKPNVGKSSIFNQILKNERVVVSNVPGTTRTAIDSEITIDGTDYTFIDTAGLKKKAARQAQPDVFSSYQTYKSIRRSDVCFFVIDATEEVTSQDQSVAQEIISQEKGCIVLVNKIDLYDAGQQKKKTVAAPTRDKLQAYVSHHFPFLWMCPVFFVSGKTGEGLSDAITAVKKIDESRKQVVDPEALKDLLARRKKQNPPKRLMDQKEPKVYSLAQVETNPPKFELLVNHTPAIQENFRKSVENAIIKELDFWGTPIKVRLVKKV